MTHKLLKLFPSIILLAGCSSAPPVDYTSRPLAKNYQTIIRKEAIKELKDPRSAQVEFGRPITTECENDRMYKIPIRLNAKNSFGGYTGFSRYEVYMSDSEVKGFGGCSGNSLIHSKELDEFRNKMAEDGLRTLLKL